MKPLLYVDGYNIIGAWTVAERESWPLDESRDRLAHLLADYAGYTEQEVWLVFDGYKGDKIVRSIEHRDGLTIVFTKQGETADQYIERACHEMPKYRIARVATSDSTEQTVILGRGATRMSARELLLELSRERRGGYDKHRPIKTAHSTLSHVLTPEQYAILEKLRRQK